MLTQVVLLSLLASLLRGLPAGSVVTFTLLAAAAVGLPRAVFAGLLERLRDGADRTVALRRRTSPAAGEADGITTG